MSIDLRIPNITGNEKEQLTQIRSYLIQLIPQLQWALNNVNASEVSDDVVRQLSQRIASASSSVSGGSSGNAEITFAKLKPLIIKSADIVQAYYEEINKRLQGIYVAESDFGTFVQQTELNMKATSEKVDLNFTNTQAIIGATEEKFESDFNKLTESIDGKINDVNGQIDDVNDAIEDTNEAIGTVNTRIDETNVAIGTVNTRIDETNEKIIAVEDAIDETNTRIDGVNSAIESTNAGIRDVNSKLDATNENIDGLRETIEDTNTNIDILIEAKDLNKEDVDKLNSTIKNINGAIDEINTTVESIEADVETIDGHVQDVDDQVVGVNGSVENVQNLTNSLNTSVQDTESAINDANTKVDNTNQAIEDLKDATKKASASVEDINKTIEELNKEIEHLKSLDIIEVDSHIHFGLLYYDDDEIPVYGIEIGQTNYVNGVEVFEKYTRFTADRVSFYDQNNNEVAYISDYKLYIANVEIIDTLKMGGFVDTVQPNGDIVTRWVGRS